MGFCFHALDFEAEMTMLITQKILENKGWTTILTPECIKHFMIYVYSLSYDTHFHIKVSL